MRRVATHRAVLRSAWLGAQHKMSRGGAVQLSPREEAGRLLGRQVSRETVEAAVRDLSDELGIGTV